MRAHMKSMPWLLDKQLLERTLSGKSGN